MAIRSATINVMANAAYKAARGLVRDFGEVENLQVSRKGPADFVSAADIQAEKVLRVELSRARPGFGFLLEEGGEVAAPDKTHRWIVDPLDGTTNFLHGVPHFSISIGLQREQELLAGVVYDPLRDELFWAEKGQGAWVNDHRLRVSARRKMADAVLATGAKFAPGEGHENFLKTLAAIMDRTTAVRRLGSAALDMAYVAAGRFDGFWECGLSAWDLAAGIVLVREAGGFASAFSGGPDVLGTGEVVAGNTELQPQIAKIIAEALA